MAGQLAVLRESSQTSWCLSFHKWTENLQEKDLSIYIDLSVGMRCPWRRTLEEADTDTSRWLWRMRSTGHRQYSLFCRRTTQATNHRAWGDPKNKRSELKSFDKTKSYFENTPPWTEPWEIRSSWRWNQSSYPHWWIISQGLDRCPHLPCCNILFPDTGQSTKLTSRKTQSRLWVHKTPRNPLPD